MKIFDNSHDSILLAEYFIDFLCEIWIPCQAVSVMSVLCLHYRPETVHCSTKDVYTSEITFLALYPCSPTLYLTVYILKLRFSGLIRKFKKNESFTEIVKANIKICMQKTLGFSRSMRCILALKLGYNLLWCRTLCTWMR